MKATTIANGVKRTPISIEGIREEARRLKEDAWFSAANNSAWKTLYCGVGFKVAAEGQPTVYWFVTSDKSFDGGRMYSIRTLVEISDTDWNREYYGGDAYIETVSFQEHSTADKARRAMLREIDRRARAGFTSKKTLWGNREGSEWEQFGDSELAKRHDAEI